MLVAVDRERVRLAATVVALGLVAALVVWQASRATALTHVGQTLSAAAHDGHRVAAVVLVAAIVSGYLGVLAGRVHIPREVERAAPWAAVAVLAVVVIAGVARFGAPWTIARHGYDSFTSKPPASGQTNLNSRLFSLSNNGRLQAWKVALHGFEAHPLGGLGAGGFEQYWNQHRPAPPETLKDAHSLYLQTLAETGIVGFLILAAALAAPLGVFRRVREEPLAAAALAAYVAFLVEAAVDWDWQLSGVTLAALLCGGALLAAARSGEPVGRLRLLPAGLGAVVAVLALGGLVGNLSLNASAKAANAGKWSRAAADARRARFFAPWSAQPWERLGDAQLGLGERPQALASFRTAVAKDPRNWQLWVEVATAAQGAERKQAFAQAAALDPLEPAIAQTAQELGK